MTQPTISVPDFNGEPVTIFSNNPNGQGTKANSAPVVIASDQDALPVSGGAAAGSAPTLNPVAVSGVDGGGLKRHLLTDSSGAVVLAAGPATAAKQPALGTAGTPSADVISVQGVVGGKPVPASIDQTTPGTTNRVEVLGTLSVARSITVTTISASQVLTAGTTRVSLIARTCDMRVIIGATATTSSHFLMAGERIAVTCPAGSTIAAIRDAAASSNGILEITELN